MKKFKFIYKFTLWLTIFIVCLLCLWNSSTKMIYTYASDKLNGDLTSVAYSSIRSVMLENNDVFDMVSVMKDNDGQINMISVNTYKVNELAFKLADVYTVLFNVKIREGIDIPLGVFTGIRLLSGVGKKVNVKILSINSVNVDIVSEFKGEGINQTKQQLFAIIKPSVNIVTRNKRYTSQDEIKIILYDSLIMGKVPDAYLNPSIIGKTNY